MVNDMDVKKMWMILSMIGALVSTWFHVAYQKLKKKNRNLQREKKQKDLDEKTKDVRADIAAHDIDELIDRVDKRLSERE